MRAGLPSGTVTFLFSDIEGSTGLLHELGAEGFAAALAEHRRVLRAAFAAHAGVEVDTQGDAFFVAFADPASAVAAAESATGTLAESPVAVRIGLHTGTPHVTDEGYVGEDVHLGARIGAAGHGGQVLVSGATRALIDGELTELGEHRLKDFPEPVAIFQLGSKRFPPLKTVSNTNLPSPASSFFGRDREVAEIAALVRGGARLVTLTGPGGSGKTRLAIEAAGELVAEFKAGVFWVGLATIREPALVAETISQTVGAKGQLAEWIGGRELLLLLDNLEQVIDAAPALADLLEACPNLRLLITSRELMRVRGELAWAVPPLHNNDALALFSARARIDPDETVSELCRRLDNLPLALELAAARTGVLTPAEILARLTQRLDLFKGGRDADPRQQTLRATIEWSHDLLSQDEQRLFARMAVFRGGCTLHTAETVAEADLDVLQSLVDKSLLRHSEGRFWMLETIRDYATERLAAAEQADDLRQRHARYFLALAEQAHPNLRGDPQEWLDRLERENDNLRAALDTLEASGHAEPALALAGALYRFWNIHGHFQEGRRRLERLLAAEGPPTLARARALDGAAAMAINTADTQAARLHATEALAIQQKLHDRDGAAYSIYMLGHADADEGKFLEAQQLFEESLRRFQENKDNHYTLIASDALAWTYGKTGDDERRLAMHKDVLRQAREQANQRMIAMTLQQLAMFATEEGRITDAISMLYESLHLYRELGDRAWYAATLGELADPILERGNPETAAQLVASSEALREELAGGPAWLYNENKRRVAKLRDQLDTASFDAAWREGLKLTPDQALALVSSSQSASTRSQRAG